MSNGRPPSTDVGTVLLHWVLVALFIVLLGTGARIASADPGLDWLGLLLDPVLPVEHLWYRHLVAAAGLAVALVAYAVYVVRARLAQRVRLDWARVALLLRCASAIRGAPGKSPRNRPAAQWQPIRQCHRENPERRLVLIAGVRDLRSFYMWPALNRLARVPNVSVIATAEQQHEARPAVRRGRPSDHLPELAADDIVYAAGAPKMVDSVATAAGAARAMFYCDPFEASGRGRDSGGWLNVLSWIRAA